MRDPVARATSGFLFHEVRRGKANSTVKDYMASEYPQHANPQFGYMRYVSPTREARQDTGLNTARADDLLLSPAVRQQALQLESKELSHLLEVLQASHVFLIGNRMPESMCKWHGC